MRLKPLLMQIHSGREQREHVVILLLDGRGARAWIVQVGSDRNRTPRRPTTKITIASIRDPLSVNPIGPPIVMPPGRLAAAVGTAAAMRTDDQPAGDGDH